MPRPPWPAPPAVRSSSALRELGLPVTHLLIITLLRMMAKLLRMASADLLLHPVRLRIIKAFLGDRALTTTQLAAELDDVPAGSLYRHIALLTRAGLLHVVAEHRIRGTVERTYALRQAAARLQPGEAAAMTPEEHSRAFMVYVAGLLADFDRYLATGTPDLTRDRAGYTVAGMYLTDAELAGFLRDFAAIVQPLLANAPGKGRRRRIVYSIFLPEPDTAGR
jgi:DNA-binding transcriptional ArsR family regulator